ncbi:metallophosphoesterase family protein [Arundinibacter roseus]|uniref:Phosphoesterase n=1 Tax=Arundinibacter roseus TaxID=2070510 RepID=A0A4R4KAD7_9BACT|nr:metallophosphoesterase family protein [Arundinibacter roseus]TDB64573.1 metallophosphoesterase [Arundinibacter roseus]
MTRIGLLSDTHGFLDEAIFEHFATCDELWHAGDVGSTRILDQLEAFKPLRVVFGNIDNQAVRIRSVENLHFELEGFRIWMTHIGGAPPGYNPQVRPELRANPPHLFVCGHSHILRVIRDPKLHNMLYINPGAAGKEGFHNVRTLLRFVLHEGKISEMEVVELGKRGALN